MTVGPTPGTNITGGPIITGKTPVGRGKRRGQMAAKALSDRTIKALKPRSRAYIRPDGIAPGFGVRVMPSGHKTFVLVSRFPGSRNPVPRALGAYGALTLAEARVKARDWLEMIATGRDPTREKERQRDENSRRLVNTFAAVVEDYVRLEVIGHNHHEPRQRKGREVARDLRRVFVPLWGNRPISDISRHDVLAAIEAVRDHGTDHLLARRGIQPTKHRGFKRQRVSGKSPPAPVQARNLLGYLNRLFSWAIERGTYGLESSPCDHLRTTRIVGNKRSSDRILTNDELFALQRAIKRFPYPYGPAYQLLLLSGLRLNEVADATWPEIDAASKLWTIPASRMKGKNGRARPHVVPLTAEMMALLEILPRFEQGDHLFSTTLGAKPVWISDKIKKQLDRRMLGTLRALARMRASDPHKVKLDPWVNHDLRRTLRSRLSMLRVQPEVAEAVLAHVRPGIKGVYDRYDFLDERRAALELWATHLKGMGPRVDKGAPDASYRDGQDLATRRPELGKPTLTVND
jgi:integrase